MLELISQKFIYLTTARAYMGYAEELEKLEADEMRLQAQHKERRPEQMRKLQEELAILTTKTGIIRRAAEEAPELARYDAWLLRTLINDDFHVMARFSIISKLGISNIREYKNLLRAAAQTTSRRELKGINKRLKELMKIAKKEIAERITELSKEAAA